MNLSDAALVRRGDRATLDELLAAGAHIEYVAEDHQLGVQFAAVSIGGRRVVVVLRELPQKLQPIPVGELAELEVSP